ncbi:37S ribosomal protein S26 [Colletotrichum sidae]|uniref:37S ribosomal protein S26 n=4 Tax=Colletotrichum orbiculare species complex TaxID=2707354 RepID=N4VU63_COLOR|nr:37S ribosomal protein S26 [Colletotrichum orbiculare MAFF 240422]TDZ30144.1 37S ribosomal protein S26 [Colletotrichum spinosum]TDZ53426.1 37S ribosomal protein S26 [Colletotrichum trifolii]TEA21252.1 37S ribosomal protein S26 [Colletotrichum sidae]
MFRARLRIPRISVAAPRVPMVRQQHRSLHDYPDLPHDFTAGVPGLLSADGFDMAWTQYMRLILDKLNALTAGTDLEQRDSLQILLATARDPDQAPVFNHASMLHNTHFFFKHLTPNPQPMPEHLANDLVVSFSSLETLRREMVLTASTMFGPGFVWLVKAGHQDYRVLTTYLAGSPHPGAHWRLQSTDMNTVGLGGSANGYFQRGAAALGPSGAKPPGALDVVPLLCLNTWEHTWLRDYGIGAGGVGGKKAFAEAWWEVVDWNLVADLANIPKRRDFVV